MQPTGPAPGLPKALVVVGSVAICLHLGLVGINVLAAASGPWPTPEGPNTVPGPEFAQAINQLSQPTYLSLLKMNPDYHFGSNKPGAPGVYFEARVKDEEGNVVKTVRIPDPGANRWVRHRQQQLAMELALDRPVPPQRGEALSAPGEKVRHVEFWDMEGPAKLRLKSVPEHLLPRDRPLMQPSEVSLLLARSYARYLRRTYGGARVEIVRHSRDAVSPSLLFEPEPPAGTMEEINASFGEISR